MNVTASTPVVRLTPMQRRVFDLMCRGLSDQVIVQRSGLPGRTVKGQIVALKERFQPFLPEAAGGRWLAVIVALILRGELRIETIEPS